MNEIILYSILSVFIISLISLIGVLFLSFKTDKLNTILIYFISFSAGALFGDVFIHLIPSLVKENEFSVFSALFILFGILIFFILEKILHWQHCHMPITKTHVHTFAYMNLVGDSLHNFIDGLIIAASYLVSIPIGIATTLAVVLHEIPQEIGDFGVLLHGGFSKSRALLVNFITALTAFAGLFIGLWLGEIIPNISLFFISIAAGGFIYIAGSDLIPELHKETSFSKSLVQTLAFILGILVMFSLLLIE
ncbi:MAG: ZIP family metal transporter [Nanoarchaeota archaeon]|nr:ZIP family metal transporter [Nanoarchaeota archaeon]